MMIDDAIGYEYGRTFKGGFSCYLIDRFGEEPAPEPSDEEKSGEEEDRPPRPDEGEKSGEEDKSEPDEKPDEPE